METALQRDSVSLPALEVLVKLYARDGKAQEAVRRLSALTSQHPKNAGLQFLLGLSYFSLKDLQKARRAPGKRSPSTLKRRTRTLCWPRSTRPRG